MKIIKGTFLLGPFICLVIIFLVVFSSRTGVKYDTSSVALAQGQVATAGVSAVVNMEEKSECALIFDSTSEGSVQFNDAIAFVLDKMGIVYDNFDASTGSFPDLENYQTVTVAFDNLDLIGENALVLCDWVKTGGRALFAVSPSSGVSYQTIYPKLGIQYNRAQIADLNGLRFEKDLMPGSDGMEFGTEAVEGNTMKVSLADDCITFMTSNDENRVPLLWEHDYGQGVFVVSNCDIMKNKEARGVVAAAYSLLNDVCVYPVINSSLYYIDDFPAPIPEGYNDLITEQYGRSIESFYVNEWWPSMLATQQEFGLKYTGVMIETYAQDLDGDLEPNTDTKQQQYFGALLLLNGGELGLHGYNHVPLCLYESDYYERDVTYKIWPSEDQMIKAMNELTRYAKMLFPENSFETYVPPSNILSEEGRAMLIKDFPQIRMIAGSYLEDKYEVISEIGIGENGVVYLPRVASGYELTPYMRWAVLNEIGFQYYNAHFVHPDDILDMDRGAEKGWEYLKNTYRDDVAWVDEIAPDLQQMTSKEGSEAVIRYSNLTVYEQHDESKTDITLQGFSGEAWLMMRLRMGAPSNIEGGTIEEVGYNLYLIHATQPSVTVYYEGKNG